MNQDQFQRITEEYVKRLFLDEGLVVSKVTNISKIPNKDIPLTTTYSQNWLTGLLKIPPPKPAIRQEKIHLFAAQIELGGKLNLSFSVDEGKFLQTEVVTEKGLFFNAQKQKILRPIGFAGLKSIWDYILLEVKKLNLQKN